MRTHLCASDHECQAAAAKEGRGVQAQPPIIRGRAYPLVTRTCGCAMRGRAIAVTREERVSLANCGLCVWDLIKSTTQHTSTTRTSVFGAPVALMARTAGRSARSCSHGSRIPQRRAPGCGTLSASQVGGEEGRGSDRKSRGSRERAGARAVPLRLSQ